MYTILFWWDGEFQTRRFDDLESAHVALDEITRDGIRHAVLLDTAENILESID